MGDSRKAAYEAEQNEEQKRQAALKAQADARLAVTPADLKRCREHLLKIREEAGAHYENYVTAQRDPKQTFEEAEKYKMNANLKCAFANSLSKLLRSFGTKDVPADLVLP